ncbi:MAG: DUF1684 domain-containing protein [Chloroflexi bacterium]|nr:DUF1684 domain-containing protein [Chloroflexota bacterium]
MNELERFRAEKDEFFRSGNQSPLTAEQQGNFKGLTYYPENLSLRLELVLERFDTPVQIVLATSTGAEREYTQIGQIRFELADQEAVLQVYEDDYGFFLPFSDATAPAETYGSGRYLEPHELRSDVLYVDFNLAYNPYCAYNERWSCPLPPVANRLNIRIDAGEKKFHD